MKVLRNRTWTRRGCSLLWDPTALVSITDPREVVSLRQFVAMGDGWPDDLPSNDGDALVVAGVEGCLDALSPEDAETWIERDLRELVFRFQDHYQGEAALVFWMPSGRQRRHFALATSEYSWAGVGEQRLPIGRLMWAGARSDVERIVTGGDAADIDGDAWIGMYHPRLS